MEKSIMSNQANFGDFCWNELMTTDVVKAKEFYSKLFGWTCHDHDMGHMTYTMFKSGNKDLGGIMQIPKDQQGNPAYPSHWMSYIFVENVDNSLEKAKSLGATVVVPATPISDFGRFAVITDPTGANIAMWQSLKSC